VGEVERTEKGGEIESMEKGGIIESMEKGEEVERLAGEAQRWRVEWGRH
jgi:hypothetical protein